MKHPCPAMLALLLMSCAESTMQAKYEVPPDAALVQSSRAIRLDVYPPGNLELMPQSFTVLPNELEDVYIALAPTVAVSGTVMGKLPSPVDITIPSEDSAPVEARITFEVPDTVMQATTVSGPDGRFSVRVPASVGYRAVAVATDPTELPLFVEDFIPLTENTIFEMEMGLGVPVSGTAMQSDGSALPAGSEVHLVDTSTGESGPKATLSPSGDYLLRALPGEYTMVLAGAAGTTMPSIPFPLTVAEDDFFVVQDLLPGTVSLGSVSGSVVDEDGRPVDNAEVRFSALDLDDLPDDASAEVATDTDRNGLFNRQLALGQWELEVIPPYETNASLSPTTLLVEVDAGSISVGEVMLGPQATIDARVVFDGQPVRNVVVTAQEQGFNHYTYSATSAEDGSVRLAVPNVPMNLTLQSPDADQPITRLEIASPEALTRIELDDEGSLVTGILLDPDGFPLPYALVEIRDSEGVQLGTTLTDDNGEFRVTVALLEDFELDTAE